MSAKHKLHNDIIGNVYRITLLRKILLRDRPPRAPTHEGPFYFLFFIICLNKKFQCFKSLSKYNNPLPHKTSFFKTKVHQILSSINYVTRKNEWF